MPYRPIHKVDKTYDFVQHLTGSKLCSSSVVVPLHFDHQNALFTDFSLFDLCHLLGVEEEEFTIMAECAQCTPYQMRSWPPCHLTGFIEQINCSKSNKLEYKRQEEKLFWKFEGVMMTLTVVLILLVIARQRCLDRRASEKVRRQIESI